DGDIEAFALHAGHECIDFDCIRSRAHIDGRKGAASACANAGRHTAAEQLFHLALKIVELGEDISRHPNERWIHGILLENWINSSSDRLLPDRSPWPAAGQGWIDSVSLKPNMGNGPPFFQEPVVMNRIMRCRQGAGERRFGSAEV